MKLIIDGNEANVHDKVGSNIYAYELIKYFYKFIGNRSDVDIEVYMKDIWQTIMPIEKKHWKYRIFGPKPLWTRWRLPLQLYSNKLLNNSADLIFTPGHYAPRFSPIPSVISIMDLAFYKFKNEFRPKDLNQLQKWTELSVKNAKHIFSISHSTKKDIIKQYDIDEDKITVTHLGFNSPKKNIKMEKDRSFRNFQAHLGITKPYILYIGTLQPRKNLERLIDAFVEIKKQRDFNLLKLVIVGKKGWLYKDMFDKVKKLKLYNDVIFTGFISDWEKYELLRYAELFVLPSLYEGFGLPVLEAMSVGCPVVLSKVSSLPEVGGNVATYIENPYSSANIAKTIVSVLKLSDNRRLEIIAKGKTWTDNFTWEKCARQTFDKLLELGKDNVRIN